MKKYSFIKFIALIFIVAIAASLTLAEQGGKGPSSSNKSELKAGDSYDLYINNFEMPIGRNGILADVVIPPSTLGGGKTDNKIFLFSGGFFMSGYSGGKLWANGQMSASRITDYVPGNYATGQNDPKAQLYVVKSSDPDWSQSWQDWKDAVAMGADYYDGNKNGVYDPLPLNSATKWDSTMDRPDILGDATVWCVYSDQLSPALRTYNDVNPQGIEIRQTVFAFNSKAAIGNMVFVRYKIVNTGKVADVLDTVYFSVADDPDIGDNGANDLVGCDTTLNCGFTYHKTGAGDGKWGTTPPCFMVDFFQGPKVYIPGVTFVDKNNNGVYDPGIDTPIDTATDVRGKAFGVMLYPGAKNLGISSFFQYYNGIDPANRFQCRYYTLGKDFTGSTINPCTWAQGTVTGVDCKLVDPFFMYSGDPITKVGWVNTTPKDQRQMTNTGPFKLVKNDTVTIVVAYMFGKGTDYLNSVDVAKTSDQTAKTLFKANFPSLAPPPPVEYTTQTGDGFIDITWPTYKNIQYKAVNKVFAVDRNIHGFYITQYFTNAKSAFVNNQPNSKEIARYDLKDAIQNIFYKTPNGGIDLREPSAPDANKLDSLIAIDTAAGRIKFRLTNDPSTGNDLIKGHEYYFTITEYTVNNLAVVERSTGTYGPVGDYYDASGGAVEEFETPLFTVTMGSDEYSPVTLNTATTMKGSSSGAVKYVVVDQTKLTGNNYKVDFVTDKNPNDGFYNPTWSLINTNTGDTLYPYKSSTTYIFDTLNFAGTPVEGIVPRVKPLVPEFGAPTYTNNGKAVPDSIIWYTGFGGMTTWRGVFYMGKDIPAPTSPLVGVGYGGLGLGGGKFSNVTADRLRKVELRFGDTSYAYRYINGILGTVVTSLFTTVYAGRFTGADTIKPGNHIGNWNSATGTANGFVKVPFSAWVVDSANGENYRLATAFIERKTSSGGNPDGIWDPGTNLKNTWEAIVIFDSPYHDTAQVEYTGNLTGAIKDTADIFKGYTLTDTSVSLKKIAINPWFNTLYTVALERTGTKFFSPGDHLNIPMVTYPYTSKDEFRFTTKLGNLADADKKSLFDRVNVFPNPLYGYNPQTSYTQSPADEPFVTFSNLPGDVTINIFTLSGTRIRTLTTNDKSGPTSPFLRWNLKNEAGLRAASGMYLAIVSSPGYGNKVLKFAIIMPQKQIKNY